MLFKASFSKCRFSNGRLLCFEAGKSLLDPEGRESGSRILVPAFFHDLQESAQMLKSGLTGQSPEPGSGWPGWASFRLLNDCLL
jgi:hypothetical protein